MTPPSRDPRRLDDRQTRESMREALDRALHHTQLAVAEGVLAMRALLDAASIGVLGEPALAHPNLVEFARTLDQIADALSGEAPSFRSAALATLLSAVDREIQRWEARSQRDPDARAVLRAFLGMREVLWELGVRKPEAETSETGGRDEAQPRNARSDSRPPTARRADRSAPRSARVQRIIIQS